MDKKDIIRKLHEIQMEILDLGWKNILKTYHPDINIEHNQPHKLFSIYKYVYGIIFDSLMVEECSDAHKVYNKIQKEILMKGIIYFVKGGKLIQIKDVDINLYLEIYNAMIATCARMNDTGSSN